MNKILLIEDNPDMRENTAEILELAGYEVMTAEHGKRGVQLANEVDPELIICDIMMPELDGFETLRLVREISTVPVVLLTVKADEEVKIRGLELGADDYVTKPFDPRELLSRVKNLLWRVQAQEKQKEKGFKRKFEGWSLDLNKRELSTPGGELQSLSAGEFHLLLALIENAGEVMTRDQLMNRIRNREWYPDDRYIDVLVGQVRRKFRQFDPETTFISTIHGTGYLFAPTVT